MNRYTVGDARANGTVLVIKTANDGSKTCVGRYRSKHAAQDVANVLNQWSINEETRTP